MIWCCTVPGPLPSVLPLATVSSAHLVISSVKVIYWVDIFVYLYSHYFGITLLLFGEITCISFVLLVF